MGMDLDSASFKMVQCKVLPSSEPVEMTMSKYIPHVRIMWSFISLMPNKTNEFQAKTYLNDHVAIPI